MTETRTVKLTVTVEPSVYALVELISEEEEISVANYIRQCVLSDLEKRDVLTREVLLRIVGCNN